MFINNYGLNTEEEYWKDTKEFLPERFIENNQIKKPDYFIPFSTGKRSCMGTRMVKSITLVGVTRILQKYDVESPSGCNVLDYLPKGNLALKTDTFPLIFKPRCG